MNQIEGVERNPHYSKEYYIKNREQMKQRSRDYRAKIQEYTCACGSTIKKNLFITEQKSI